MSGVPEYPPIDPRRGRLLREDLLRDIAELAPGWRAVAEESGADRALVQIAARLLEQSTRRLDKTPERDGLAFLDMLNVPAPQPRSAEGHAVVALAKDREGPETLPARSGFDLDTPDSAVRFETTDVLTIQNARIEAVFTVDPASDRIGSAPATVVSLEPEVGDALEYILDSAVGAGDRVLRLSFATGLEAGNLLRIDADGDVRIRVIESVSEDGLVTLTAPVGGTGLKPGIGTLQRMTWLDAFAMPDEQEHAFYIGDAAALDVSPPAEMTLTITGRQGDGAPAVDAFGATPMAVEIWGQRADQEDPAWHALPEVGRDGDKVTYLKAWDGPVLELEIAKDIKNRWLRMRRLGPVPPEGDGAQELRVDGVLLEVAMLEGEDEPPADTISQAVHNATPLPISSAFLPFGAEPQRFDVFALAAPEVFTKAGATATLKFDLQDATLEALAAVLARKGETRPHVFGIGKNGRLQVIDRAVSPQYWLEVTASAPDQEDAPKLSPEFGVKAATLNADTDLVLAVSGTEGATVLHAIPVKVDPSLLADGEGNGGAGTWEEVPKHLEGLSPEAMSKAIVLVPMAASGVNPSAAQVLWASDMGVQRFRLDADGTPSVGASWEPVPLPGVTLDAMARLAPVGNSFQNGAGEFLVTDEDKKVWVFGIDSLGAVTTEATGIEIADETLPAGAVWRDGLVQHRSVVGQDQNGQLQYFEDGNLTPIPDPNLGTPKRFGLIAGIAPQRATTSFQYEQPSIVAVYDQAGTSILLEWNIEALDRPIRHDIGKVGTITAGLAGTSDRSAQLVTAGATQSLAFLSFNPSAWTEFFTWLKADVTDADRPNLFFEHSGGIVSQADRVTLPDADGARVLLGQATPVDGNEDITLWLLDDELDSTFDDATKRVKLFSGDLPAAGEFVFVAKTGGDFHRYMVAAVQGGNDSFTVVEDADLSARLAGAVDVKTRKVAPTATADEWLARKDAPSFSQIGTQAVFSGIGTSKRPASMLLPGAAAPITLPTTFLELPTSELVFELAEWAPGDAPPDTNTKIVPVGKAAQSLVLEPLDRNYQAPELSWEYFDGKGWKRLDKGFDDETRDLARSGKINFTIPSDLSKVNIGGQDDLWIRARLVGGDYGRPKYQVTVDPPPPQPTSTQTISVLTGHMRPPEIAQLTASFANMPAKEPGRIVARNNLRNLDQTSANKLKDVTYPVFQGAHLPPLGNPNNRPTLFLGLSEPLSLGLSTLFARAEDREELVEITLETLGADLGWTPAPLADRDPTGGFLQSGLLHFTVAEKQVRTNLFGKSLFWLRIVGRSGWRPQVHGLWLNGVRIVQAKTVRQEIVGTSLGEQSMQVKLLKSPVLENTLELRVRESLSSEEVKELREGMQPGRPDPVRDDVPNVPGQWVLWHQVPSLDGIGPRRAYLLTPDGTITFGTGESGRIPPAGRDNIRAFSYQVGGEPASALPATKLKPLAPPAGFELAFTGEAVAGGTTPPDAAERLARMPAALRHQNRAVSLSDLEAIARDFDTDITQVKAEHSETEGGPIRVDVLAKGKVRARTYSKARREALAVALASRMSAAYGPECLDVQSVLFARHKVEVSLRVAAGKGGAVDTEARNRLKAFFDPARGGPGGAGWPIGRPVWPIDIDRALRGIDGLDAVTGIEVSLDGGAPASAIGAHHVVMTETADDLKIQVREGEEDA
ncbi:hypothetical protein DEA8626_03028 [Defluviimonas aquaemixtae]|uniref:Baseplate protein J-like domain-containing protein n=1 Tax=Albidovulum aquaemixtae TaxID=1542388 RepID=A0A2R8BKY4_9RHOB|nr:hypothetical protein [Defluviimonas aquaemixtae]SPH23951.1 hypothetical protein DEA8626_03028 [Defluviimonas aquaemixtae]